TTKEVEGLESLWQAANESNRAYLPYNPDPKAPGRPQRATPPIASQGMMAEVQMAAEDMKGTTGVYDAALGNRSNETSGVAIRQRQMEADVGTSIYSDNMAKAVEYAGRIIVDLIPKIYDTRRVVAILGANDEEKLVAINDVLVTQDGIVGQNNITQGQYAVKISVGPNYSTMRQEAAENMIEFVRAFPAAAQVTGDLIAKNMDWPQADEFAERLKKLLPPGIAEEEDGEQDPQVVMLQQQLQQAMQAMEQMQQDPAYRKAQAEANEAESDAEKARFETIDKQLETMAQTGQLDAAIGQLVQQEVARALQSVIAPQF
ncbi:MAG: portal protein, partial [Pikeienuella sp.]